MILAMIEDDPAEGVIDTIVNVIAAFAVTHGFANDPRYCRGRRGHQKTPRLGQDLHVPGKKAIDLDIYFPGELTEWLDMFIVRGGKASSDVEDLQLMAP